ncbi:hypothetical protein IW140_002658 [Coemansia sp. RSA 1813]|nr:hypothetical protein EV178_000265 [Coemansia sp. RSA 1646]KAJ1772089.1 hypothetical protein LPJ74_001825 [Coemansia sp. RSA 1843]KAJ2090426.1 hypothetical protein IW138_002637 [Coemansia sp. RSA 986]KAJ2215393.1 hypothetical protein EV179_002177 [Coemansia sp. RSA 487]KAJ2569982.1 hypothetical protein IW140_002658 [Coemansia sp. RSA 1813]
MTTTPANKAKHEQGLKHKEAGNQHFKAALKQYHFALLHLRGLDASAMSVATPKDPETMKEEDVTEQEKELSAISSNMAACHMRLQRYDRVVTYSEQALKHNPFNIKAKFRLAQSHVREGALEKATKVLDELEKQSPGDAGIAAERRNILVKEKQAEDKQRKEFGGMFDRAKKTSD